MAQYYVNDKAQSGSGDHEVHVSSCRWIPHIVSKTRLGDYASCGPAVAKAKTIYPHSDGCETTGVTLRRFKSLFSLFQSFIDVGVSGRMMIRPSSRVIIPFIVL